MADLPEIGAEEPRALPAGRRWLQFGFATLLKFVAVAAVLSAWWADRERLTQRITKLKDDQNTLRLATEDDFETATEVYSVVTGTQAYGFANPVFANLAPPPPPPMAAGTYGTASTAIPGPPTAPAIDYFDDYLYEIIVKHKEWLGKHLPDDRGWQKFLAEHKPGPRPDYGPGFGTQAPSPPQVWIVSPPAAAGSGQTQNFDRCLAAIIKLLDDGGLEERTDAVNYLHHCGTSAEKAIVALARAVNDADPSIRETAIKALSAPGLAAKAASPRLQELLKDRQARCPPARVAQLLLRIDPQADVADRLIELLGEGDLTTRRAVLTVLWEAGRKRAASAAPAVAELLKSEDAGNRIIAADTYRRLAERDDAIVTLKTALREEKSPHVKRHLARVIVRLQNGPVEEVKGISSY